MDAEFLMYVAAVYVFAGFVKGFSGLGFSAISIGILAVFIDLKTAIPLVVIPSTVSSLLVMIQAGGLIAALRKFWLLYVASLPGLAIGIWLLVGSDGNLTKIALGCLLLLYSVWALMNPTIEIAQKLQRPLQSPIGFLTGVFCGMTGVCVMPVSPYLLSLNLKPLVFVQALNISFIISSSILIASLGGLGYLDTEAFAVSVVAIVPVSVAVWLGGRFRRRVSEGRFKTAVLGILMFLGANLVLFS